MRLRILGTRLLAVGSSFLALTVLSAPVDGDVPTTGNGLSPLPAIPLHEAVWIQKSGKWVPLEPATEDYYRVRIAGHAHIRDGKLVFSTVFDGRVVQVLDNHTVLVDELSAVEGRCEGDLLRGYQVRRKWLVETGKPHEMSTGLIARFQVEPTDRCFVCKSPDGRTLSLPESTVVESPSLSEYLEFCRSHPVAPADAALVPVGSTPDRNAPKVEPEVAPPPPPPPPTPHPAPAAETNRVTLTRAERERALEDLRRREKEETRQAARLAETVDFLRAQLESPTTATAANSNTLRQAEIELRLTRERIDSIRAQMDQGVDSPNLPLDSKP